MHTTSTWSSTGIFSEIDRDRFDRIEFLHRQSSHFSNPENPGQHEVVSQGNFHAEVLALVADAMSLGLFELSSISERRIDQMLDPDRRALRPFLAMNLA